MSNTNGQTEILMKRWRTGNSESVLSLAGSDDIYGNCQRRIVVSLWFVVETPI
jgi:hypothetical protein